MDIKYRLYPHPVLWEKNDDYKTSTFECAINIERSVKNFIVETTFKLKNTEIEKLIESQKAEFILHIECSASSYRIISKTLLNTKTTILPDENLLGKISFCPFIVAKENIKAFTSGDWDNDYDGLSFDFEKGTIIAIGTQETFFVDKGNEDLSTVPSIFTICKQETAEDLPMQVELGGNKITIGLNIRDYENYFSNVSSNSNIINSFIIFPVLIFTFERLKEDIDNYADCRWFKAILKMFQRYSMVLNDDLLSSKTSIELAQQVMNLPVSRALLDIQNIANIEED